MAPPKTFEKIAITGATGHIGQALVTELLKTGKHTITALTRAESKRAPPNGVKSVQVDYNDQETLIAALRGQDFLIIALAITAPPDTHSKLVKAAASAGVPYVMPNCYGADIRNPTLANEPLGAIVMAQIAEIESLGLSYVTLACGVWYEWSLALGDAFFGFDIKSRKAVFLDDGKTALNVSTWEMCGRAVTALLNLPESGASPALEDWKNEPVYVRSFRVTQRDMLDSLHRVLGTTDEDWAISYEPAEKRAQEGLDEFAKGIITGRAKNMYSRHFMRARAGELEFSKDVANEVLGLAEESLDEATKKAVEMLESGFDPLA